MGLVVDGADAILKNGREPLGVVTIAVRTCEFHGFPLCVLWLRCVMGEFTRSVGGDGCCAMKARRWTSWTSYVVLGTVEFLLVLAFISSLIQSAISCESLDLVHSRYTGRLLMQVPQQHNFRTFFACVLLSRSSKRNLKIEGVKAVRLIKLFLTQAACIRPLDTGFFTGKQSLQSQKNPGRSTHSFCGLLCG